MLGCIKSYADDLRFFIKTDWCGKIMVVMLIASLFADAVLFLSLIISFLATSFPVWSDR